MQYEFPSLRRRFFSLLIDQVLIIVCMVLSGFLFDGMKDVDLVYVKAGIFVFLFLVYEPLFVVFGCTLGNYLSGIRVRRVEDPDRRITLVNSYVRLIMKVLLGIISFSDRRRAIHNKVAKSVVVMAYSLGEK